MKRVLVGVLLAGGLMAAMPQEARAQVVAGFDRYGHYRIGYDSSVSYYSPSTSYYYPATQSVSYYNPPVYAYTPSVSYSPVTVQSSPTGFYTTRSYYYGGVAVPASVPVQYRSSFYPTYVPVNGYICP